MAKVFISFRRSESADVAKRIYERLAQVLGQEHVAIEGGADAGEAGDPQRRLRGRKIMLVLIGPHWLDAKTPDGTRLLDDPQDAVRVEIETALRLKLLVCPILVEGGKVPAAGDLPESLRAIHWLNALAIRDGTDFEDDVRRLARQIGLALKGRGELVRRFTLAGRRAAIPVVSAIVALLAQLAATSGTWLAPAAAGTLLGASVLGLLAVAPGTGPQIDTAYHAVHPGPTATATATATATPTFTPTPSPTPTPTFTPTPTSTPIPRIVVFKASPLVTTQSCGGDSSTQLPSYQVTLDNRASTVVVRWTFVVPNTFPDTNAGSHWADVYDATGTTKINSGSIAAGRTTVVTIKPHSWICGTLFIIEPTPATPCPQTVTECGSGAAPWINSFSASFQPSSGAPPAVTFDTVSH